MLSFGLLYVNIHTQPVGKIDKRKAVQKAEIFKLPAMEVVTLEQSCS